MYFINFSHGSIFSPDLRFASQLYIVLMGGDLHVNFPNMADIRIACHVTWPLIFFSFFILILTFSWWSLIFLLFLSVLFGFYQYQILFYFPAKTFPTFSFFLHDFVLVCFFSLEFFPISLNCLYIS